MRGAAGAADDGMTVTTPLAAPPLHGLPGCPPRIDWAAGDEKMVEEAVMLLERLVSFDTTSRNSNLP